MGCGEEGWKMGGGDIDLRDWFAKFGVDVRGPTLMGRPIGPHHHPTWASVPPTRVSLTFFLLRLLQLVTSREMHQIYSFIIIKLLNRY